VVRKLFDEALAVKTVQVNVGVAPRMWSATTVAAGTQRDGDQKGVTNPYAVLLGNESGDERSEAESAARASGEAHRVCAGRESADGLTAPS